jgi:hypothetical protein
MRDVGNGMTGQRADKTARAEDAASWFDRQEGCNVCWRIGGLGRR